MFRATTMLDSRGKVAHVPMPSALTGLSTVDERQQLLKLSRAAIRNVSAGIAARVITGVLLGVIFAVVMYVATLRLIGPADHRAAWSLGILMGLAAAFGGFCLGRPRPRFENGREMLSRCQLCVVCAYDLRRTRPSEDGCVVCAECGGAWRLEVLKSAEPRPEERSGA